MHIINSAGIVIGSIFIVLLFLFGVLLVFSLAAIAGDADTRLGYKDKID
jgi:hypothetical protein